MVLKTDVLGRVRVKTERREAILDEFEKSGVAGAPFAKMIGVNYQTFASWAQKRRKARGQYPCLPAVKKTHRLKFMEAVVAAEPSGEIRRGELTIELPGGANSRPPGRPPGRGRAGAEDHPPFVKTTGDR